MEIVQNPPQFVKQLPIHVRNVYSTAIVLHLLHIAKQVLMHVWNADSILIVAHARTVTVMCALLIEGVKFGVRLFALTHNC